MMMMMMMMMIIIIIIIIIIFTASGCCRDVQWNPSILSKLSRLYLDKCHKISICVLENACIKTLVH